MASQMITQQKEHPIIYDKYFEPAKDTQTIIITDQGSQQDQQDCRLGKVLQAPSGLSQLAPINHQDADQISYGLKRNQVRGRGLTENYNMTTNHMSNLEGELENG